LPTASLRRILTLRRIVVPTGAFGLQGARVLERIALNHLTVAIIALLKVPLGVSIVYG